MAKHLGPLEPVTKMRPHVRDTVDMLRANGAKEIVVIQPKHYRISFSIEGCRREIGTATSPSCPGDQIKHARRALKRFLREPEHA